MKLGFHWVFFMIKLGFSKPSFIISLMQEGCNSWRNISHSCTLLDNRLSLWEKNADEEMNSLVPHDILFQL